MKWCAQKHYSRNRLYSPFNIENEFNNINMCKVSCPITMQKFQNQYYLSIRIISGANSLYLIDCCLNSNLSQPFIIINNSIKMSKDAIILAIDTGSSMDQMFSETNSRAQIAFECVKLTLQQKLFNNSSHEVGMVLFGDNQTTDGDNLYVQQIAKPTLDLVRKVEKLGKTIFQNDKVGGDLFSAINFSVEKLIYYCGTKKYNKRVFVFTNGNGQTSYNVNQVKELAKRASKNAVKINIITIDFMEGYDIEANAIHGSTYHQDNQEKNANLLIQLKQVGLDNIQIFPASIAIELYRQFRKKETNPVAAFRGKLEIAPGLGIEVATYKKIRQEKLKSLKKYNLRENFSKSEKENLIQTDVVFQVHDDPTGEAVQPEYQTRAYQYGKNIVPINEVMENGAKIFEQRCFKLLGFVHKQKVPRHAFMGDMDIVIPGEDQTSKKLFSSFIFSMMSLNRYALARYIPRNMKSGINPKLMLLIPYKSSKGEYFYMTQMPTAEDVRDYQFLSLKASNEKQKALIEELINNMDLMKNEEGEEQEILKVKNTFNPTRQHFFQSIFHRALTDADDLPPLDPAIASYLNPEVKIYQKTANICQQIKKEFSLVKKELKEKKDVKFVWRDLIKQKAEKETTVSEASTDAYELEVGKKFTFQQEQILHVNPKFPIESFNKMLTNPFKDLVETALRELAEFITKKVEESMEMEGYKMALIFMKALRVGCQNQKEVAFWDSFLEKCIQNFPAAMVKIIKEDGIGYLERDNKDLFGIAVNQPLTKLTVEVDDLD